MQPVFALEPIQKSIFLAGPTPRSADTPSWRPEALATLETLGFDGRVYVPEARNWAPHGQYDGQIAWEWEALNASTVIAFWVPRDLDRMPALTTNVEFGLFAGSGKVVLGFPEDAVKMKYLAKLAERYGVPVFGSLRETLVAAVDRARSTFGAR